MLQHEAIKQLNSLNQILNQITDDDYVKPIVALKNASVGKHIRHIAEFYQCLLFNETNNGINYDDRKRNHLLETNVQYSLDYITEISDAIEKVVLNKPLLLTSKYGGEIVSVETSLYRELAYNIEHTVHHLAIINIAINIDFNYIQVEEFFGYADSTIQYLKKEITTA